MTQSKILEFHMCTWGAALLLFTMTSFSHAQVPTPPSIPSPPAANSPQNGDQGSTTMPQPPNVNGGQSGEDYDSSTEPFGRGCPFRDNDLQLVS